MTTAYQQGRRNYNEGVAYNRNECEAWQLGWDHAHNSIDDEKLAEKTMKRLQGLSPEAAEIALHPPDTRPHRQHRFDIRLEGHTLEDCKHSLLNILIHWEEEAGPRDVFSTGGYDARYSEDPTMTQERYERELQEYVANLKEPE